MRFLKRRVDDNFILVDWKKSEPLPKYAILSHTWHADDTREINYNDIKHRHNLEEMEEKQESYEKLLFATKRAAEDGLEFIWIDTCCIDRSNAVELQEAIASMFRWYRGATKCYAYLSDVSVLPKKIPDEQEKWMGKFETSRWFKRSWTLQELLAPTSVEFFSVNGVRLGDKRTLQETISTITEIPKAALRGTPLHDFTVDERLSWARNRHATRGEDEAYALCGLFDVYMVLVYGEQKERAFKRLREEIDKLERASSLADDALSTLPESLQAAFDSFQRQYDPVCLPNTRVELLSQIKTWIGDPGGLCVYWLNGLPGTGKSTIARTLARHCKKNDDLELGGNFFFSRGNGPANGSERVFTTIAKQLASTIPTLRRHVCSAVKDHTDIASKSLQDQWEQLIIGPLLRLKDYQKPIVLVFDALDECENQKDVEIILRLVASTKPLPNLRLRFFFTSRPSPLVQSCFEEFPERNRKSCQLHKLRSETINSDLEKLFEDSLYRVRRQRRYDNAWPSRSLISRLVSLSYGLFIWARVACDYISNGKLAKRRAERLASGHRSSEDPSSHLDQLYITVLTEADKLEDVGDEEEREASRQMTQVVLGSIIILKSQLSANALASLLDIEVDEVKVSLSYLHTVIDVPDDDNQDIRLHHPTFREFMLDPARCSMPHFVIDQTRAHRSMAMRCTELMTKNLTYNICKLKTPGERISTTNRDRLLRLHLPSELQYAILEWSEHFRRSGGHLDDDNDVKQFILSHALHWIEAACVINRQSEMVTAMRTYHIQLRRDNPHGDFASDLRRMVYSFGTKVAERPLQLYCSALAFIRPSNLLRNHFWNDVHPWFKQLKVVQPYGPEAKDDFNYVNSLAFTPDGRQIASGSLEHWTRVWDVSEMKRFSTFRGTDKVSSVSISSDGKLMASGADDSMIHIYDLESRKLRYLLTEHTGWVNSVAFSPDNSILVSGCSDESVRTWNPDTGKSIKSYEPGFGCINSVAFHPKKGSSIVALGCNDPAIYFLDLDKSEPVLKLVGHEGPVNWVHFSDDGLRLVSGSDDCTARVWNADSGECIMILRGHEQKVWTAVFPHDSHMVATGSEDRTIKLWSSEDGKLIDTLDSHTSGISAIAFSPDNKILAAVAFNDEVRFWDAKDRAPRGKLPDFIDDINMNSEDAEEVEHNTAHASNVSCLVTSPDRRTVASGSSDGKIKIWTGAGEWRASLEGHESEIHHIVFSTDAELIASASAPGSVRIWKAENGKELHNLDGHKGHIQKMRFSHDRALLASCATDNLTKIWDTQTGQLRNTLDNHWDSVNDCSFSSDDSMMLTCSSDKSISLWKLESDSRVPVLTWNKQAHDDSINSAEFSPNSNLILTASSDKMIKLWDIDGMQRACLRHHDKAVKCASFSKDMRRIVSTSGTSAVISNIADATVLYTIDAKIALNDVRFSDWSNFIETERGQLQIPASGVDVEHMTAQMQKAVSLGTSPTTTSIKEANAGHSKAIFVTNEWVTQDSQDILWLPEWQRADCVVTIENKAILGHGNGALTFLELQT